MPLVDIRPNTAAAFSALQTQIWQIRPEIKALAVRIWGAERADVIVNLHECTVVDAEPGAADAVFYIETTPGAKKEARANDLLAAVGSCLLAYEFEGIATVEVWVRFLRGSWSLVSLEEGRVIDTTDHEP